MRDVPQVPDGPDFIPGLDLAEAFFHEAVEPVLARAFPELRYTAALIGPGSEVLGFDTAMSTDHGWGPRTLLFLPDEELARSGPAIHQVLGEQLPRTFRGYSTSFTEPDPSTGESRTLLAVSEGPIQHRVEIHAVDGFLRRQLGVSLEQLHSPRAWLLIPQQRLRSVVAGRLFRDDLDLESVRRRLAWYPHDVWLYLLASGWSRIGEDEHLMGRAGFAGDELGSAIIAARLVRDVMRLAFLMERDYAPYGKWLGTAFSRLACADTFEASLGDVLQAPTWQRRDGGLALTYERLATMHNDLHLTPPLPSRPTGFYGRPFQVIHGEKFAEALVAQIPDGAVGELAKKRLIGNIDFVSDNTDLLEDPDRIAALRALYR